MLTNMEYFLRWYKSLLILTLSLQRLIFALMVDGLWTVRTFAFSYCSIFSIFTFNLDFGRGIDEINDELCIVLAVFNVTNQEGNKITEEPILDYIMKVSCSTYSVCNSGTFSFTSNLRLTCCFFVFVWGCFDFSLLVQILVLLLL